MGPTQAHWPLIKPRADIHVMKRLLKLLMLGTTILYALVIGVALLVGFSTVTDADTGTPVPYLGIALAGGIFYLSTIVYACLMVFLGFLLIAFSLASPPAPTARRSQRRTSARSKRPKHQRHGRATAARA